jgi:type VI protein secretion system component VasK
VKEPRAPSPSPPPPLEANDRLVTGTVTAGWAVALIVLLVVRGDLPAGARWWVWTCVAGLVMGLFGLWYVPRLKRSRARAQSAPRDNGSNTVSSTDTPGKSTMS